MRGHNAQAKISNPQQEWSATLKGHQNEGFLFCHFANALKAI